MGMEVLIILLRRAMACDYIYGCLLRGNEGANFSISHFLFDDDMVVFYEPLEDRSLH